MLKRLRAVGRTVKQEITVYRLVLADRRTPRLAKWMLWLAIGYVLLPFDLIPDFIPVLGHVDDLVVVPALIVLALWLTPTEVVADCRREATEQTRGADSGVA